MEKTNAPYEAMLSLLAEMALDESICRFRQELLYKEIDQALACRDQETFLVLTSEWKELQAKHISNKQSIL